MKNQRGQRGDNKNQNQDGQGQGKGPNRQQKKHGNWAGHQREQSSKPDKHGGSGAGRQQGGFGAGRERG